MQPLESELAPERILPAQLQTVRGCPGSAREAPPGRGPSRRPHVSPMGGQRGCASAASLRGGRDLFASDEADGPFTFMAICDSLKFDAIYAFEPI
jgi:hypothetical protein